MSDAPTPITDDTWLGPFSYDINGDGMAAVAILKNPNHSQGAWVKIDDYRELERQLTEAREQRDRLADAITAWNESLDLCECDYGCDGRMPLQGEKCAKCLLWEEVLAALAVVKGGVE